jgi:hypothetical protein
MTLRKQFQRSLSVLIPSQTCNELQKQDFCSLPSNFLAIPIEVEFVIPKQAYFIIGRMCLYCKMHICKEKEN